MFVTAIPHTGDMTDPASQDVEDNLDAVERRISSIAAQLLAVQEALATWKPSNAEKTQREVFERYSAPLLSRQNLTSKRLNARSGH